MKRPRFLRLLALGFAASAGLSPCAEPWEGRDIVLVSPDGGTAAESFAVPGPFDKNFFFRFSGKVDVKESVPVAPPPMTAQNDINFRADLACLVIRQFDADGRELAADASLGAVKTGTHSMAVETAPLPGVTTIRIECRLSGIKGKAAFSHLTVAPRAGKLYLPEKTAVIQPPASSPTIEINGKPVPALAVHGQNLETSPDVSGSIRDTTLPYANGLRLLSFNTWFPGVTKQNSTTNLATLTQLYPDAHFLIRLWLGPRGSFFKDYPEERMKFDDGEHTANIATPHSVLWKEYVQASLRRMILELRKLPAARQIAGIIPLYYMTGEWQLGDPGSPTRPQSPDFRSAGFDEIHRAAFARWAVEKYGSLANVNKAWETDCSAESGIRVPTTQEQKTALLGDLRDPVTQRREWDFSRFQSQSAVQAIEWSVKEIKRAFHERVIAGPFYGYALEHAWNAAGLQQQGHLALGELLRSPAIDFYGGPYSYNSDNRAFGKPVDTNSVMDSAALHGKLVFLEEDTYTHVARPPKDFVAPGEHLRTKTLEETLAVLKRNLGVCMARGYLLYWMGLLEDGRFDLPEIWDAERPVLDWLGQNPVRPAYRPQMALVVDEPSVSLMVENSRALSGRWLYELRSILSRVDTSLGIYLQSDLDLIPDSVRCLILATPYHIDKKEREALKNRWMKDNRTIVFCQLPGIADGSPREAEEITGIRLEWIREKKQPTSTIEGNGLLAGFAGRTVGIPSDRAAVFWRPNAKLAPTQPLPSITDPSAEPMARYQDDPQHRVSIASRRLDGWTSLVTGVHSLSPSMWRTIAADAGAHLYLDSLSEDFDSPDVVEATGDFLMIQSGRNGPRVIRLPSRMTTVETFDDSRRKVIAENADTFTAEFQKGIPRFFLLHR